MTFNKYEILELYGLNEKLTVKDMLERLDVTRQTLAKYLTILINNGFLRRDNEIPYKYSRTLDGYKEVEVLFL